LSLKPKKIQNKVFKTTIVMTIQMKVPTVGESVTEVTIATWSKKDGDFVKMDEVLCELESDKATFELPAEGDGILRILAKEGETLAIGAAICSIEVAASAVPTEAQKVETLAVEAPAVVNQAVATSVIEVKIPAVGESVTEVTISTWSKKNGDSVSMDENLCELESDKATFELPAEAAGILKIVVEAGTTVAIGTTVATITVGGSVLSVPTTAPNVAQSMPVAGQSSHEIHTTPVAAKILAEKGIDPATVAGSGVGGRVMKEDALKAEVAKAAPIVAPAVAKTENAPVQMSENRGKRREKMTSLRKTVARRLVAVKNETAMLTTFNEVDMKPVMDLRTKFKDKFKEKHGVNLGFMSFFTKAVCVALKEFPAVNAQIDGDEIVYNDYADISIAVSAPKGLVVPVVRNAEKMSFAQIEAEIGRLAVKARDNKLTLEEMSGGTFTITNGGVFGSLMSTPIINAPQVAILGMHAIKERPVVVDGQIVIRPMMYLALSYDHRIIDGKESVSFLVKVKEILEDPTKLLFDL
jgi:2-oxoglutarate dehydrogenase E2 component (dihydrolipoamide succinyltransferase)